MTFVSYIIPGAALGSIVALKKFSPLLFMFLILALLLHSVQAVVELEAS